MVFNSYIFILAFLPLVVIGYFLLNKFFQGNAGQVGLIWLLVMSFVFFAYSEPVFLLLLLASIIVNYALTKIFNKLKQRDKNISKIRKIILISGIIINLIPLIYFKYSNFLLDSIGNVVDTDWSLEVGGPLGISFFTFLQIAYLVDCYREEKGFDYTFLEYALYVAFFPKITMGPIVLHREIMPQLREKSKKYVDYNNLSHGFYAFSLGLAKKVLLADTLAKFVNVGLSSVNELNTATALIVMFSYTLQLYFDFSGYCDMAMGVSKMLNIDIPYNFNSPYRSKSISEFWDRWHITLTRFFTHYVYIPLGGSRKGKIRTYFNILIVFLLSGLWHGANWTFIFWGLLHGILMTVERISRDIRKAFRKLSGIPNMIIDVFQWLVTFIIINITWVFFRAESVEMAFLFLKRIFSGGWRCHEDIIEIFDKLIEVRFLKRIGLESLLEASKDVTLWLVLLVLVMSTVFLRNTQEKMNDNKYNWVRSVVTVMLMVWCVISLSDVSEFLYFNF